MGQALTANLIQIDLIAGRHRQKADEAETFSV